MLLVVGFGVGHGTLNAIAGVLAQILEPYGVAESHAGTIAFTGMILGGVNTAVVGFAIDKYHKYRSPLLGIFSTVSVLAVLQLLNMVLFGDRKPLFMALTYLFLILTICVLIPDLAIVMDFGVELTYPHAENVSTSALVAALSGFTVLFTFIFSFILGGHPTQDDAALTIGVALVILSCAVVVLYFCREELRRLAHAKAMDSVNVSRSTHLLNDE